MILSCHLFYAAFHSTGKWDFSNFEMAITEIRSQSASVVWWMLTFSHKWKRSKGMLLAPPNTLHSVKGGTQSMLRAVSYVCSHNCPRGRLIHICANRPSENYHTGVAQEHNKNKCSCFKIVSSQQIQFFTAEQNDLIVNNNIYFTAWKSPVRTNGARFDRCFFACFKVCINIFQLQLFFLLEVKIPQLTSTNEGLHPFVYLGKFLYNWGLGRFWS